MSSSTSEMSGDGVAKKAEKVKLAAKKEDGTRVRTQSASVQPKKVGSARQGNKYLLVFISKS